MDSIIIILRFTYNDRMEDNRPTPYPLRIPQKLREALQIMADHNKHALSQEILEILRAAADQPTPPSELETRLEKIEAELKIIRELLENKPNQ